MDTLELEQLITDVQTVATSLAQLRRLDSATMQSPESITVYHQTLYYQRAKVADWKV